PPPTATHAPYTTLFRSPVLICKGQEPGQALDTDNALKEKILPLATVVTPNMFETRTLAGVDEIRSVADLAAAARRIHALGPRYRSEEHTSELQSRFDLV